jgi:hypothetical protein
MLPASAPSLHFRVEVNIPQRNPKAEVIIGTLVAALALTLQTLFDVDGQRVKRARTTSSCPSFTMRSTPEVALKQPAEPTLNA